ncbi:MAG: M48 family metallopeptidase [Candidatus Thiodiazotropha endolucinida]|nr:M48 family metallopeptidase [Candidatus Thiodiazotropha taylori]MCW4314556.1 M48 family metallopeptidase [Candidatus Thiodiazotropha taylori]
MKYSNPQIPEGINTSKQHPLKEFLMLSSGVLVLIVAAVLLLGFFADKLAHYIPFEVELKIVSQELLDGPEPGPMQSYLEGLTERIVSAQGLSEEMPITVHYVDDDTVNAFATLGGHIYMFRGLLEKLPNENALAMVLAHEIAHIKHRHPIRSLGRGITIGLALSMVSGTLGDMMANQIVSNTGMVTSLTFSRDQERESDKTALETLMVLYGNVVGADQLFVVLQNAEGTMKVPEFFSTHPLSEKRIQHIHAFGRELSGSTTTQQATPLPLDFTNWLSLETTEEEHQ